MVLRARRSAICIILSAAAAANKYSSLYNAYEMPMKYVGILKTIVLLDFILNYYSSKKHRRGVDNSIRIVQVQSLFHVYSHQSLNSRCIFSRKD
jgi:hypothetical protein